MRWRVLTRQMTTDRVKIEPYHQAAGQPVSVGQQNVNSIMLVCKTSLDKLAFLDEIAENFMTCLGAVALATTIGASNANADCGDVSIGAMGWASGESITAVATFVLEVGYGCNVSVVPTDTIPAVTSLAENGQPDIVPEVWLRNSAQAYGGLEDKTIR